ncbi:hypothetical protein NDG35_000741 [Salmonella enterica]|nr:hypothetical protein [Salmonella enterica]
MPITSAATYARAFKAESNLHHAAGNYENKLATKFAKGVVGVLTLGIGYGIFRLIEDCRNVKPKVAEFCANAEKIHAELAVQVALQSIDTAVEVWLNDGRLLTLQEFTSWPSGERHVSISDGEHTEEIVGTLQEICAKLEKDFEMMPGLYDLSKDYMSLASLSEMSVCKISPVINFSESDTRPKSIYPSNMRNIHQRLSQTVAEGNTNVTIPLHEGLNSVGAVEFIEALNRNSTLVRNSDATMIVEGGMRDLCQELETIFYILDPNDRFKSVNDWIAQLADPCEMADEINVMEAISPGEIMEDYFSDESAPLLKFVDDHYR